MDVSVVICCYRKSSVFVSTPLQNSTTPLQESTKQITLFLNTVFYTCMQLCVGDEFLFPLAKPSRSFQNLTETPPRKTVLLSSFCSPEVVKMATKTLKIGLQIKLLLSKMILTTNFSIVKMLARDVTIFSGEKFLLCSFIYFKMLQHHANISV